MDIRRIRSCTASPLWLNCTPRMKPIAESRRDPLISEVPPLEVGLLGQKTCRRDRRHATFVGVDLGKTIIRQVAAAKGDERSHRISPVVSGGSARCRGWGGGGGGVRGRAARRRLGGCAPAAALVEGGRGFGRGGGAGIRWTTAGGCGAWGVGRLAGLWEYGRMGRGIVGGDPGPWGLGHEEEGRTWGWVGGIFLDRDGRFGVSAFLVRFRSSGC